MNKLFFLLVVLSAFLTTGCAVPQASVSATEYSKQFNTPPDNKSGLYIYRSNTPFGAALKKDIWVNGECVGESAYGVFFYYEVPGDQEYTIATESEFSPNEINLSVSKGLNYFIKQYIKLGVFVGGANVKLVDPEVAKKEISGLKLAVNGYCSTEYPKEN